MVGHYQHYFSNFGKNWNAPNNFQFCNSINSLGEGGLLRNVLIMNFSHKKETEKTIYQCKYLPLQWRQLLSKCSQVQKCMNLIQGGGVFTKISRILKKILNRLIS